MTTILTPLQINFLENFFQFTQDFYLTGGTALSAFYLQHRYSVDLDLFTRREEAFPKADDFVNATCAQLNLPCLPVEMTPFFKHFRVGPPQTPLTLHFSKDVPFHIKPPNRFGGIIVDSIEDIAANKICATLGRTEIKDLVDLYFLDSAGYSVADYFDLAQQKDGGLAYETLAYTLNQFHITKIPSFMINPMTVEQLNQYKETMIEWLLRKAAPTAS